MSSARNPGRVAGYWYLLLVLLGPLRLIYIPNKLFVQGNAAATASNTAPHQGLFRGGMVSALLRAGGLLFPMGALAYKSRFVPRFIGVWLVINGIAYVIQSFTGILFPAYQNTVFRISQPALFGELAIMLWLLIKGGNPPAVQPSTAGQPA